MKPVAMYSTWIAVFWLLGVPLGLVAIGVVVVLSVDARVLPFDNADLWWLIGVVPFVGLVCLYGFARKRQALRRYGSDRVAHLLAPKLSASRPLFRSGLLLMAVVCLVAAILGPRWGIYMEKQVVHGVDIVVALDVSRSMLAQDVAPNRLTHAKKIIRQQLTERAAFQGANRLALMAFAGSTSIRLPLTTDHLAFRSKLDQLHVGSAPRGGTAVGLAIQNAVDLFARSPKEATRIVLLFTDGEDHEGGAEEAAKAAYENEGIRVFTVGIGDPNLTAGAQVPSANAQSNRPLLHDGQIVFSKLDVAGLRRVAEAGAGRYAPIERFHRLVDAIAGMRKTELTAEERMRHVPRYQIFLVVALLLIGLESIISDARAAPHDAPTRVWQQEMGA